MKVQLNDIRAKCNCGGKEPENHSPGFDYCRKLIREGADPKEKLEIYRGETLAYSMIIEEGAKWKIRESDKVNLKIVKYVPNDYFLKGVAASPSNITGEFK